MEEKNETKILIEKKEINEFKKNNKIHKYLYPKNSKEIVEEFYNNNYKLKVYYQGIYAVKDDETQNTSWIVWERENFVESYLKLTEKSSPELILTLLGESGNMSLLRLLIDLTLNSQPITAKEVAIESNREEEDVISILSKFAECGIIKSIVNDDCIRFGIFPYTAEFFIMILAGLYKVYEFQM